MTFEEYMASPNQKEWLANKSRWALDVADLREAYEAGLAEGLDKGVVAVKRRARGQER